MKKQQIIITALSGFVVMAVAGFAGYSFATMQDNTTDTVVKAQAESVADSSDPIVAGSAPATSTESSLLYLIEEEKLAHDVYMKMYEKYGANVFGNILQSEATHQDNVLGLMQARSIADPRSTEIGVFKNSELQKLYDQLIAQGNQNVNEAYKVGVVIEEKDIADINTQLSTASDSDIITTLESLRRGSENHLRAFNRQAQ